MSTTATYPDPQILFHWQYEAMRRDEVVGVLLAFFLGCFGLHHFYLGRTGLGILYFCFCWTGIPWILGVIECFFMPSRVRTYNAVQAAFIAGALGIAVPGYVAYPGWVAPGAQPTPAYESQSTPTDDPSTSSIAVNPVTYPATPAIGALAACPKCGRVNPSGSKFCSACASPLT